MGTKIQADRVVEKALAGFFPNTKGRTASEESFINDLSCLRGGLKAAQLEVLARVIRSLKAIIDERANSN
jgi:hypothetical protein